MWARVHMHVRASIYSHTCLHVQHALQPKLPLLKVVFKILSLVIFVAILNVKVIPSYISFACIYVFTNKHNVPNWLSN